MHLCADFEDDADIHASLLEVLEKFDRTDLDVEVDQLAKIFRSLIAGTEVAHPKTINVYNKSFTAISETVERLRQKSKYREHLLADRLRAMSERLANANRERERLAAKLEAQASEHDTMIEAR